MFTKLGFISWEMKLKDRKTSFGGRRHSGPQNEKTEYPNFFASRQIVTSIKLVNTTWKFHPLNDFCREMSKFTASPHRYLEIPYFHYVVDSQRRKEGSMKDSVFGGREAKVGEILTKFKVQDSNSVTECSKLILSPVNKA